LSSSVDSSYQVVVDPANSDTLESVSEAAAGEAALEPDPDVVERLVANHRQFLRFLQSRVRDRDIAEDILQAAFVRSVERADTIRDGDRAVAWFYRLLRNALVDHYRRSGRESRRVAPEEAEAALAYEAELRGVVCECVEGLIPTLRPEYAEMIRRVDLREEPLSEVARELGITPNNAAVRLHRARKGLKRQLERSCGTCATHGCLDCRCGSGACAPERPHHSV
jgi:RNA polymerase sigma-70 factor (ECF subfamily)